MDTKKAHFAICILTLLVVGCTQLQFKKTIKGNGEIATEIRKTTPYHAININGNIDISLVEGNEGDIKLRAEENILEYIEVNNTNGVLRIKTQNYYNIRTSIGKGIRIEIPVKEVSKLELNGSGEIKSNFILTGKKLVLNVNGSGDIKVATESNEVKASISGSGDINVRGKTELFYSSVTGSGDINAAQLNAAISNATVTGSGDITLYTKKKLTAKIIGSGDIRVNSDVLEIEKKIVGSGNVTKN